MPFLPGGTISSTASGDVRAPWWEGAVIYQIYPRSFADSNGDGVGDLNGITSRLDYLAWLGVDALWLNPIMPSPNDDWGYDVSDYCEVHPDLGNLVDFDALVTEAAKRDIRILLDLVPNHTSDRHPWFQESRDPASGRRDFYVWEEGEAGGALPNNWVSGFGGAAWTWNDQAGAYYLHNFLISQPDLNWWEDRVRDAFDEILRFWYDRGVAGFRIDVANFIVKDVLLRDNPPLLSTDHPHEQAHGQRLMYNANRPETHEVLRRWRTLSDHYQPPRLLLGEVYVLDSDQLAAYYGNHDELQLAFNFLFVHSPFDAEALSSVVAASEAALPAGAWPVWTGSNHDAGRMTYRWARGEPAKARCAIVALLGLRGTIVLYYGDELAMPEVPIPPGLGRDLRVGTGDPAAEGRSRDQARTPMQWSATHGGGFTNPGVEPWLPIGTVTSCNVENQRADPDSTLNLCRALIQLRRTAPDLRHGGYERLDSPEGAWVWQRGSELLVAANLSAGRPRIECRGSVLLSSAETRPVGTQVTEHIDLAPWEAIILRRRA